MAKDRVTANSTQRVTRGRHYDDPSILSNDSVRPGTSELSYLTGARNNDHGYAMGGVIPSANWEAEWRMRRCLLKHTVDQGLSTWDRSDFPRR